MYAAIIEWPSDAAEAPELITADTVADLLWPVIQALRALADDAYSDSPDFIAENPYPTDANDIVAQAQWLQEMRYATTAPWVEVYQIGDVPKAIKLNTYEVLGPWTPTHEVKS